MAELIERRPKIANILGLIFILVIFVLFTFNNKMLNLLFEQKVELD